MGKDENKRLSVFKRLGMSSCLFCCMPFFVTAVYACVLSKASMPYFSSTVSIVQVAKVLGTQYVAVIRWMLTNSAISRGAPIPLLCSGPVQAFMYIH